MASNNTVLTLRKVITSESEPLARRFRALFSLKHLACLQPPTEQTLPAIEAIAAALSSSSSELLKHELAYCLGQTRNPDSVSYLQDAVRNTKEDAMCRHEAAEALGALGFTSSLELLQKVRDDENELDIMRETCDIAVDRILWENSEERKAEKLKPRYVFFFLFPVLSSYEYDLTVYLYLQRLLVYRSCPAASLDLEPTLDFRLGKDTA